MYPLFWLKSCELRKRLNVDCHDRTCKIVVELWSMKKQVQMFVAMKDHRSLKIVVVPDKGVLFKIFPVFFHSNRLN